MGQDSCPLVSTHLRVPWTTRVREGGQWAMNLLFNHATNETVIS